MDPAKELCLSDPESSASEPNTPNSANDLPPIIIPPYWQHQRSTSSGSHLSLEGQKRAQPIHLEDHTENNAEASNACWARSVKIEDYAIVQAGTTGIGAYVVWNCKVETLDVRTLSSHLTKGTDCDKGGPIMIRKRYSEFDCLRQRLCSAFPGSKGALPPMPPKSALCEDDLFQST